MPTATRAGWSGREETKDDLRELSEWDGGSIAHNLKLRWERGKRFTYLGPALIALGPEGQPPPPPLAPEERRQYRTCNAVDLDPHPYGVCGAALW
jgi:myosin heavy subunit